MNTPVNPASEEYVAEAAVASRSGISIIWLIPLIALAIGGWLVFKAYSEKGPTVTIHFKAADGVVAGKTMMQYRDVEIGKVVGVSLNEDLDGVIVTAELHKDASRLLGENARFWVEQPEITVTGVRGLQTLLSGVFIGIDPDTDGAQRREFDGLDARPFISQGQRGRFFVLSSPSRGSLNRGAPVLYRGFSVGEVVNYTLAHGDARVDTRIFVRSPHDARITEHTRFWNVSGVDVELSAEGVKVDSSSLVSILVGGITFETPPSAPAAEPAANGSRFTLFDDREEAFKPHYERRRFIVHFNDSVRGLTVGAPVEFRGVKMGEVVDVRARIHIDELAFRMPVYVDIEPERFEIVGELATDSAEQARNFETLIERGLRAQLRTGSLLTGRQLIEIEMYPDAERVAVTREDGLLVIPTIPTLLDTVTEQVIGLLDRVDRLPLEQIGEDLRGTMSRIRGLVEETEVQSAINALSAVLGEAETLTRQLNADVMPPMTEAVEQAAEFSKDLNTDLSPRLDELLRELKDTARSLRVLSDYLERHPDSVIRGKN